MERVRRRRTYISIALLANRFDVLWVMSKVGHADSKMTMDVYPSSSSACTGSTSVRSMLLSGKREAVCTAPTDPPPDVHWAGGSGGETESGAHTSPMRPSA